MFFEDHIDDAKYCGHLYGLGAAYIQNGSGSSTYESHPPTVANGDVPASSSAPTTTSS